MAADGDLLRSHGAELPGRHAQFAAVTPDNQHRVRRLVVEFFMEPADEDGRSRLRQIADGMAPVDLALQPDMRPRLQLKIAPFLGRFEMPLQRRLNLARRRVVTLDQVRVVAIHDPDGIGEAGGRAGMQARAEIGGGGREAGHEVEQFRPRLVEQTGFNSRSGFFRRRHNCRQFCRYQIAEKS